MGPFEKAQRQVEAQIMKGCLKKAGAPEKVIELATCLIENGCPADALINGITEFIHKEKVEEQESLYELLKDMPFKVELEGEENE